MKSFVYLDEYKMYSLSSQLMQGVTDYILKKNSSTESDTVQQNGKLASGRVMGEIIETVSADYEKKFLHDYAFTLFEERLMEEGKLIIINSQDKNSDYDEIKKKVGNGKLVQITSKCIFADSRDIVANLKGMEQNVRSLAVVTTNDVREELIEKIDELKKLPGQTSEVGRLAKLLKEVSDATTLGDYSTNDKFYHKHLAHVLESGFKDALDIRMNLGHFYVSADLDRKYLKMTEATLVKTYSRITEVEFVMLGIITQCGDPAMVTGIEDDDSVGVESEPESVEAASTLAEIEKADEQQILKDALLGSAVSLKGLEDSFYGRKADELIVNPIAVYIQL
ncbi:hypothetical protein I5L59_21095 [Pseudomonas moraviensis]|uniref:DUF6414 family protein n=1 Tax=Pseudomonas moraviensis TaxID=321662 RepID=UPI0018D805FF|nr:hypothetical protein [Pseudomonas moraviensis]MBH3446084.1 hypothetical protein [Pseudomonas moraviensis]